MHALILVGGEGTRLRPLTLTRPKPAIPLVDRPLIRFMVDWLARHGVSEIVMACGFRAEDLRSALGDRVAGGPAIQYVEEPEPLGTAGPIRLAADQGLLGERFLVLNGDILADLDLSALMRVHEEQRAAATLALYRVEDPSAYGLVRRGDGGEVLEFLEKPGPEQISAGEISAGAYVLERAIVDLIPPGRAVSIEREVFPRLIGQGLYGQRLDGYWMDIGTPERYLRASWDILEGRVQTDVPTDGSGVLIDPDVTVADGARIGPRAVVRAGSTIAPRAVVEASVLLQGCRVGTGAGISGAILAPGVEVGDGARIGDGAVIGEGARVKAGASLDPGARLDPGAVAG
jgi:mannose-1-phosphate guanylyltransferase